MECHACQEPVAVWAAFCPHCGAPQLVEGEQFQEDHRDSLSDELFGAGDGDPRSHRDEPGPVTDDVEDDTPTRERPEPVQPGHRQDDRAGAPTAGAAAGASAPWRDEPTAHDPWPPQAREPWPPKGQQPWPHRDREPWSAPPSRPGPQEPYWDEEPPRRSRTLWVVVAAILALALGFAVWSALRVGDTDTASDSPNATTTTKPRPTPGTSGASAPSTPDSPSASASTSTTPSPLPAGAISCGVTGQGDTAAVFSADQNTTCPFAQEVAAAYRASGADGASVEITAHSPVTNKDYQLTCTGTLPTTCVATTGATVYLTSAG